MANTFDDYLPTLGHGITRLELRALAQKYKLEISNGDYIRVGSMTIRTAFTDCGALQITGANYATKTYLAFIEEYASLSGFSVVIGTICMPNPDGTLRIFLNNNWKIVDEAISNRNPEKQHYVVMKRIDCIKKGY